ncbi:MAG: hypothetical protein H6721_18230 [Sandaracinus sp.]|nr:hypothetical protein [Sandaracinus sp.]MCB9634062.1 hypothetical protein [Sandaracinus sp.]
MGRFFLVGLWVWSLAAVTRADDRPLTEAVTVAREGECLSRDGLLPHLRTWLERDVVDARLGVLIEERGEGARFVVLHDGRPAASRTFDTLPSTCADRRAVLALAVALALDAALLEALRLEPAPTVTVPAPETPPPSRVHLELAAEAQLAVSVLPSLAAAWQLGPRLVFRRRFEIAASAWLSAKSEAPLADGRVRTQLAGARLELCARRPFTRLYLRGCLGGSAGVAVGRGREVPGARQTTVPFVGASTRLGGGLVLTDALALELSAEGWLALLRPRFDLVDAAGVPTWSSDLPLGGVILSLGISASF